MPLVLVSKAKRAPAPHALAAEYEPATRNVRQFARAAASALRAASAQAGSDELLRLVAAQAPIDQILAAMKLDSGSELLVPAYERVLQTTIEIEKKRKRSVPTVRVNPRSIEWARERGAKLVQGVSAQTRTAIRNVVARQVARGERAESMVRGIMRVVGLLPRDEAAVATRRILLLERGEDIERAERLSDKYADELLEARAMRIARTETVAAQNRGLLDTWQDAFESGALPDTVVRVWVSAPPSENPGRPCPICLELDGTEAPMGQSFESALLDESVLTPPAHPNCLPGDAAVAAESIAAASVRRYDGDLVVIRTAAGHRLACTPNHPILGTGGWLPARSFHIGDHVVGARLGERMPSLIDPDHEHRPAAIEQVARALEESRVATALPVPISSEDFHGDGKGSEVAVVWADGLLRQDLESAISQHASQLDLASRSAEQPRLPRDRRLLEHSARDAHPAPSFMGTLCERHALLWTQAQHAKAIRLAQTAWLDAGGKKSSAHPAPSDVEGFAQRLLRRTSQIQAHKIIDVHVQSFSNHVFNLETAVGAYIAQGLVTHNCRCTMTLRRESAS